MGLNGAKRVRLTLLDYRVNAISMLALSTSLVASGCVE